MSGPTPQRAHRPPIAPARVRSGSASVHHARLAARLTSRDRWLVAMLHEHRVLTTHAIATMAFPSGRAARMRLLQLYEWDVVDRFQPLLRVGAAPMHYVLGGAGAAVLAAQAGVEPRALGYRREDVMSVAHHHTLAHTVAVNDLFAHLVHHAVHGASGAGRVRLQAWWSQARCRRHVGEFVRPDAYGRITVTNSRSGERPGVGFAWFLELDFGTSTLATLARKVDRYAQLAAATTATPVLVWLPGQRREAGAREHLAHALRRLDRPGLVPLATTAPGISTSADGESSFDPAGHVWLPVGRYPEPGARLDLTGLAALWPEAALTPDVVDAGAAHTACVEIAAPDPVPPPPATYNPAHPRTPARPMRRAR